MTEFSEPRPFEGVPSSRWSTDRTEWFWTELGLIRTRWRAVDHPFFLALAAGRVDRRDLGDYAAEQDHVLVAIAGAAAHAAAAAAGLLCEALQTHAAHRLRQVERWRAFAAATGWVEVAWQYAEDPYEASVLCARAVAGDDLDLARHLVSLQVLARTECDVSAAVLPVLKDHYRLADARALEFFTVAQDGGAAECERIEAALQGLVSRSDPYKLLHRAETVLRFYWHLLDELAVHLEICR